MSSFDKIIVTFLIAISLTVLILVARDHKKPPGDCNEFAEYRLSEVPARCISFYLKK
jgi:hypothetical protein